MNVNYWHGAHKHTHTQTCQKWMISMNEGIKSKLQISSSHPLASARDENLVSLLHAQRHHWLQWRKTNECNGSGWATVPWEWLLTMQLCMNKHIGPFSPYVFFSIINSDMRRKRPHTNPSELNRLSVEENTSVNIVQSVHVNETLRSILNMLKQPPRMCVYDTCYMSIEQPIASNAFSTRRNQFIC